MREVLITLAIVAGIVLGALGLAIGAASIVGHIGCANRWPGYQPRFALTSGCMIVVHGQRIPERAYRVL